MVLVKAHEIQPADIARLEAELNNLWGELNTSNIPHGTRMDLEEKLTRCEEQFKAALGGEFSFKELETTLDQCDRDLAHAVVKQAENEIPKIELSSSYYLALENVRKGLESGELKPVKARHEVKQVMRHHT